MGLKNIVVINDYNYIQGGASKVAITTANEMHNLGYNVIFFCGVLDATKKDLHQDIQVVGVDKTDCLFAKHKLGAFFRGIYNAKAKKILKQILKTLNRAETIIHVHGWTKDLSASFIKVCHAYKFKTILTIHDYFLVCPNGGFFNYQKNCVCRNKPMGLKCLFTNCDSRNRFFKFYRVVRAFVQTKIIGLIKKVDAFITISDFSESILKKYLKNKPIFRVYNPTAIVRKNDRAMVENNEYYLFVGRIAQEKGIDRLCSEADKIGLKLKVVGDGPLLPNLQALYKENKNIEFLGWNPTEKTMEILRGARALIFPSVWYEGAPLIIFEALSQGVPCLVSHVSAAVNFINQDNGVIFDFGNPNWLADSLALIESNLQKYSQNAYDGYWNDPYDTEKYTTQLVTVYNKTLVGESA